VSTHALETVVERRTSADLHEAIAGRRLRFSSHAAKRVAQRGLELDDAQLVRLADGVERAAEKGSRSALIMVDHVAMVVAIPNRTVITAIRTGSAAGGLFTNIDSAVVA
jgi:flagellar operon protein